MKLLEFQQLILENSVEIIVPKKLDEIYSKLLACIEEEILPKKLSDAKSIAHILNQCLDPYEISFVPDENTDPTDEVFKLPGGQIHGITRARRVAEEKKKWIELLFVPDVFGASINSTLYKRFARFVCIVAGHELIHMQQNIPKDAIQEVNEDNFKEYLSQPHELMAYAFVIAAGFLSGSSESPWLQRYQQYFKDGDSVRIQLDKTVAKYMEAMKKLNIFS